MSNRLQRETSPYLLAHKDNPVDWYPWCEEAFERARKEDKPIFLSIGYSACHWCHVLAHESFEDEEIAEVLNRHFISIKVDKEERPDIDSVYMEVCQAFTGGGGWPTSIFMTWDGRPFFAGTYFPRTSRGGMIGLLELLLGLKKAWSHNREALLARSDDIIRHLSHKEVVADTTDDELLDRALAEYEQLYDKKHGGFGRAPKFPTPHNLLFLLELYVRRKTPAALRMAEHTLLAMYRGGIFDHIGAGFCRYSTDNRFLVPHFEKMLYDNALLILAYTRAYTVTGKDLYLDIARRVAGYILRDMTSPEGGFYSSQDADSEGEEGKYYLIEPQQMVELLGTEVAERFNSHYDITKGGNFEGKSIPNLLKSDYLDKSLEPHLQVVDEYRRGRYTLHRDEKILTSWCGLMIAAMCELYLASHNEEYLLAAKGADDFIQRRLCDGDVLYVSFHSGKRGVKGFLDDYAAYIFAQLSLYRATLRQKHLERAMSFSDKVMAKFGDSSGGYYLYGEDHEELILRPKETYDGALPSGNSLMAYNLVRLSILTDENRYRAEAERQLDFLSGTASRYPIGHAMLLLAKLFADEPPMRVTVVPDAVERVEHIPLMLPTDALVILKSEPTADYPLVDGRTTYYPCYGHSCLAPTCEPSKLL